MFEGKTYDDDGGIALDDIYIRTNITCAEFLPTTPAPTTEATTPSVSSMDCDFEEGTCNSVPKSMHNSCHILIQECFQWEICLLVFSSRMRCFTVVL